MSIEFDDDLPPLEDMSDFVEKIRIEKQYKEQQPSTTLNRKTDSTTLKHLEDSVPSANNDSIKPLEPFKRGFLNSNNVKRKQKASYCEEIPFIKAKEKPKDSKISMIPDFLKVDLEDCPRDVMRKELSSILEPTKELVKDVMENDIIKSGLEDPEIMFAVQEIAADPDKIHKYKHNPKVSHFYSQLGKFMGDKIQMQEAMKSSAK